MDPDATWAIITDVNTDPQVRRDAALDLLMWYARQGDFDNNYVRTCEAIIIAEFEHCDRLAGR